MTLTVETGSGNPLADSYDTLAAFQAYCAARNRSLTGKSDTDQEAAMREGFLYVNTMGRLKGETLTADQAGEFPRTGCTDWNNRDVTGVPMKVKQAQFEAAWAAFDGPLLSNEKRGGLIKSKTIGPLTTVFQDGAPAGRTFPQVERLMAPYMRDLDEAPVIDQAPDPEGALFSIGMHDNPGFTSGVTE